MRSLISISGPCSSCGKNQTTSILNTHQCMPTSAVCSQKHNKPALYSSGYNCQEDCKLGRTHRYAVLTLHQGFSYFQTAIRFRGTQNTAHTKSTAFSTPVFTHLTNAQQHYVQTTYTKLHRNWAINVRREG